MNEDRFSHLLSRRGRLGHPWSTVAPPPPGTISFGGGIPDPETLPLAELRRAAERALTGEQGVYALQYGGSYGDDGLREEIAKRASQRYGLAFSPGQVVVTTGSSQALDALCATFVDPGDVVVTEEPTFTGSLWTFRAHGARLATVPVDRDGMDTDALAERLRSLRAEGAQPKLIYVTPDYQNPTATRLSLERRRRLVQLAEEHGCLVVEDTAYEETGLPEARDLPTLLALAPERVVQMSTFSKTVGPGLRIGWLLGPEEVIDVAARGRTDMGSTVTLSTVMAQFLRDGALDPHLERVRRVYLQKRDAMARALGEHLGGLAGWDAPEGGFFLWLRLPGSDGRDVPRLLELAREERASFIPGFRFLAEEQPLPALRLAYSQVSLEQIPEGTRRLSRAFERLRAGQ
jgi:2-aminoadipate transaminase